MCTTLRLILNVCPHPQLTYFFSFTAKVVPARPQPSRNLPETFPNPNPNANADPNLNANPIAKP